MATKPIRSAAPVSVGGTAAFDSAVTGRVTALTAVDGKARLPGEISGPAVAVHLELANHGTTAVGLDTVIVTMFDSTGTPGGVLTSAPSARLAGVLAPGGSATGVYVFTIPVESRDRIVITVSYSSAAARLTFTGSAPTS